MMKNKAIHTVDALVKEVPDNYISARHLHKELGIWATTARVWRNHGKVRAEKIGATWFYSRQDLSKLLQKMYPITIDGKRAKLRDVGPWVQNNVLKEVLGDYISAKDIHRNVGIELATLRYWRNSARIRAKKVRGTWYYSRQDLIGLIKSSK